MFERAAVEHRAKRDACGYCSRGSSWPCCSISARGEAAARNLHRPGDQRMQAAASGTAQCTQTLHLTYASQHRALAVPPQRVLSTARPLPRSRSTYGFRFENKLLSLDAILIQIQLCHHLRPGAVPAHKRRRQSASAAR